MATSNRRPWFYTKPCNRELSTEILKACGSEEGLFIVRASSIAGAVAISCVQEHEILHHLLEFGTPGQCILNDQVISDNIGSLEDAINFLARPHQTRSFEWLHPLRVYVDAENAEAVVQKYGLQIPNRGIRVCKLVPLPAPSVVPAKPSEHSIAIYDTASAGSMILNDDVLMNMTKGELIDHIHKLQTALSQSDEEKSGDISPTAPVHSGFASVRQEEQYSKIEWEIPWHTIQIGGKIGQGSYGVVYQGKWHGDVAVKKLLVADPSPDQLALFKNEVLVLRKTRHRNVLLFMGACTVLPNLAIVTQWAEGGSLHDKIHDAEVSLPKPHKVDIACQIAQGMEYLHSKQITHRDLKSGNILIDSEIDYEQGSSPPQIRVADFGLAMMKKEFTADGSTLGSIYWMAPEIITQAVEAPYTEFSDAYSFGIVLYEMWAECLPYRGMDGMSILYMVGRGLVTPDLSRLAETTPPGMRDLLTECINRERESRPRFAECAARGSQLLKKLPSLQRTGSVSAIQAGRGKVSPIKWTPRPLSVRHHRNLSDGAAVKAPQNLSVVQEKSGNRRRAHSTYEEGGGGKYDNVQRLQSGDFKISDGPE